MLLLRPWLEFRQERILRLSSSSSKFDMNIYFLHLSFIQLDHETNEFELSKNSTLEKLALGARNFKGPKEGFPH